VTGKEKANMNLGLLIRRYRKERKFTLKTVAKKAGISEGFLSQVENNVNSPSVETLVKICDSIGVNAGDLINQAKNQERLVVIRKSEWDDVDLPHTGFITRRFFSPKNRTVIDSSIIVIEQNKSIPVRQGIKNGQELLCILKGSLELIRSEGTIELSEGDAVHYWADLEKQKITNRGKGLAVVLWVGTL
jgi:transcriptional regulator with XRE-family HTH domain